jgi:hypothetical protein
MSGEDTAKQGKCISPDERCRFSALRRYSEKARYNPSRNLTAQPHGSRHSEPRVNNLASIGMSEKVGFRRQESNNPSHVEGSTSA